MPSFDNTPRGAIKHDKLTVDVIAVDERSVYGRREYLVVPVAGRGRKWVHGTRIKWVEPPFYPELATVASNVVPFPGGGE